MTTTTKYILTGDESSNTHIDIGLNVGQLSLEGQAFEIKGSAGDNTFFLRPAGYSFDFTDNGEGDDEIYLTGSRGEYTVSINTENNVATLTRGAGATLETVKVSSVADKMTLVFADGALKANALTAEGGETLDEGKVTAGFTPPATITGGVRVGTIGSVDQSNLFGVDGLAFTAIGNGGVDDVFVAAGANVDASMLGLERDRIYLEGNWADYEKILDGFQLVLSRNVLNPRTGEDMVEEVRVIGGFGASNDILYFADGSVGTRDAYEAVYTDPAVDITNNPAIWSAGETSFSTVTDLEGVNNITLTTDTGSSDSDGTTSAGEVTVSGLTTGFAWQYSVDNGVNWTTGSGNTFTLGGQISGESGAVYEAGRVQVRQINPFGVASAVVSNRDAIVIDRSALEPNIDMSVYGLELVDNENDNSASVSVDHGDSLTVQYWIYLDAAAIASTDPQQLMTGPVEAQLQNGSVFLRNNGAVYEDSTVDVSEGWNFISVARHADTLDVTVVNDSHPSGASGSVTHDTFAGAPGTAIRIGEDDAGTAQLAGVIRDLRIWNAARNEAQAVADSQADIDVETDTDLIGYWRLDAVSGTPDNEVETGPDLTLNGDAKLGGDASGYDGGNQRFITSLLPVVSGDGASGFASVEVFYTPDGEAELSAGQVQADDNGNWQFEFASPLPAAGEYDIRIEQTDAAGNTASAFAVISARAALPNPPSLDPNDDSGIVNDNVTNVTAPTLTGNIPAGVSVGAPIQILVDGAPIVTGTANGTVDGLTIAYGDTENPGTWSYTPQTPFAEGVYLFSVKIGDVASEELAVTIDSTADAPVIDKQPPAIIQAATFAGGDLVVEGTIAADIEKVELSWNDNSSGTENDLSVEAEIIVQPDPDGGPSTKMWRAVFTQADMETLADGDVVEFTLVATDLADNISTAVTSNQVTVEFVNQDPVRTGNVIEAPILAVGAAGGTIIFDLNDLNGDLDANTDDIAFSDPDAEGSDNATLTYTATLDGEPLPEWLDFTDGVLKIADERTAQALTNGSGVLSVTATDGAGAFVTDDVVINVVTGPELEASSNSGDPEDNVTNIVTPALRGDLPPDMPDGFQVSIFVDGAVDPAASVTLPATEADGLVIHSDGGANYWTYTPENDLAEGDREFAVEVNGVRSPTTTVTIDATPPGDPAIDAGQPTLVEVETFAEGPLILSGTAAEGTVSVRVSWSDGNPDSETDPSIEVVVEDGRWRASFDQEEMADMTDGEAVTFTLIAKDIADNETAPVTSDPVALELVNEAPIVNPDQSIAPLVLFVGTEGAAGDKILDVNDLDDNVQTTDDVAFIDRDAPGSRNGTLTYEATLEGGGELPEWLEFTDGVLRIVDGAIVPDVGDLTVTLKAEDGREEVAQQNIIVRTSTAPTLTSQMSGEESIDVRTDIVLEAAGEAVRFTDVHNVYQITLEEVTDTGETVFRDENVNSTQTITVTVDAEGVSADGGSVSIVDGKVVIDFEQDFDLDNTYRLQVSEGLFAAVDAGVAIPAVAGDAIRFSTVTPTIAGAVASEWDGTSLVDGDTWYDGTSGDYFDNTPGLSADLSSVAGVVALGRDMNSGDGITLDNGGITRLTGFGFDDHLYIDEVFGHTSNTVSEDTISFGQNSGDVPTYLLFGATQGNSQAAVLIEFIENEATPLVESEQFAIAFSNAALGDNPNPDDHTFERLTGNATPVISG